MVDWNDIKKAFEGNTKTDEEIAIENEQKLLKAIANYLCAQKGVSAVQGYKPEEVVAFLARPVNEIMICLGGEWAQMAPEKLDTLVYTLTKKVKKSDALMPW